MGVRGKRHAPAALSPGKTRYPLYRRLGGPQGRSGHVRKIRPPPPGFDPRILKGTLKKNFILCSSSVVKDTHYAVAFEMIHRISRNLANPDVTRSDLDTDTGCLNCLPSFVRFLPTPRQYGDNTAYWPWELGK